MPKSKGPRRGCDKDLLYMYRIYNKKYFGNKLPKDMPVYFQKLDHSMGITTVHGQTNRPLTLHIDPKLDLLPRVVYMTLLHEMCHVESPQRHDHGAWFEKRMLRLAKAGAFQGLW